MVQPTSRSPLPKGAEISPVVKTYEGDGMLMNIQIANLSRNAFRISPHETLCELQHVEIEDPVVASEEQASADEAFFAECNLTNNSLSEEEMSILKELLLEYRYIFSLSDFDIGHTDTVKHNIKLTDDNPFKQRHRRIPPSMLRSRPSEAVA